MAALLQTVIDFIVIQEKNAITKRDLNIQENSGISFINRFLTLDKSITQSHFKLKLSNRDD